MIRFFDVVFSGLALIVLSPLLIPIVLFLKFSGEGEIFFLQERVGQDREMFKLFKFATMLKDSPSMGAGTVTMKNDPRVLPAGKFLRKTKINELPQLLNVFLGHMSLIGPRPLLMEYLPLYTKEQARRHEVKPGITGWAQINGRNTITWEEKFRLDIWYVDNQSFWLDIKIILLTFFKVVKQEGISQNSHVTMQRFKGNEFEQR